MFFLPVMLLLLSGGSARVVLDFQHECSGVFHHNIPPTVFPAPRFRQICQTLNNVYHYATLYDTSNKIPVYSAYVFTGWVKCIRTSSWYIEPQLEGPNEDPNMAQERIPVEKQASNRDYIGSVYHKGHLAPVSLANSQQCADATFTLTNAAPQHPSFNSGKWRAVESSMNKTLSSQCTGPAYIVTGVVPGNKIIKNRVRVPSHFWTAFCCQSNIQLISGAVIGNNYNEFPVQMTVRQLETNLTNHYGVNFTLFDNNCGEAVYVPVINKDRLRQSRCKIQRTQDRRCRIEKKCGKRRVYCRRNLPRVSALRLN
ncbi:endonuclease domain-containing 1 protein-like [Triplophysa rosa]|uniref:Endonuclease domain-containing 1 protein-like n=1 Tax=Triplophysa rosa TaxID=992332 RepID=A0A9W7WZT2_TRIRA|nr:endonuclease domain-containing 1 protein-like [Triplophysa rosa]KAI7811194.1 putative endonuclease domain-containing 1 protein-like [Triplophysa rosa]